MSTIVCVLCNHSTDDPLQLGEKITFEDTTAHLYCLLLASNLVQGGGDDEGLYGFLPKDIKAEVWRTKRLFCCYCHQRGSTIGCCIKACRRSFHLPCALEQDCRFEFNKTFRSFCEEHHNIKKPKNVHKPTDLCTICYDEMGNFNAIRSIPLPCCNKNAWCHKICLQKYAQSSGYFLKCPLCKDSDKFRDWIAERGVFIPDRDAKWEIDETGSNTFYGFEQHNDRPTNCVAKVCKCPKGRNYQVDTENHKYSLVFCQYCGSLAVHLACLDAEEFCCDDCNAVVIRAQAQSTNSNSANQQIAGIASSSSGDFMVMDRETDNYEKYQMLAAKFNICDCYVRMTCLKAKDFRSKPKKNYRKYLQTIDNTQSAKSIVKHDSLNDENDIQPMLRKNGKIDAYFFPVSDTESEIEIAPVKVDQTPKKCIFSDLDSDRVNNMVNGIKNANTPQATSTSSRCTEPSSASSEEEQIRPTVIMQNYFFTESSDDLTAGKENEKPTKSIAVVRPFSMPETSASQNINIKTEKHPVTLSSSGSSDDTCKSAITQRYDYMKNIPKKDEPANCGANDPSTKCSTTIAHAYSTDDRKHTPNKRKHRSVRSYFCDLSSSSDDELAEPKPKRKSPKQSKRNSSAQMERPPNQSTIINFFQRKLDQSI